MGVTRLKRKERRNRSVAKARIANIKLLTKTPVIKRVDIEELKKQAQPSLIGKVSHMAEEVVEKVKHAVKSEGE